MRLGCGCVLAAVGSQRPQSGAKLMGGAGATGIQRRRQCCRPSGIVTMLHANAATWATFRARLEEKRFKTMPKRLATARTIQYRKSNKKKGVNDGNRA